MRKFNVIGRLGANMRFLKAAALLAFGLQSCAAIQSEKVDYSSRDASEGLHYSLPKALFQIELYTDGSDVFLGVSEPIMVGDPQATYTVSGSGGLLASQNYVLSVHSRTRLLSYVRSESEGQAGEILVSLARAAGASSGLRQESGNIGGDEAYETQIIYSRLIDPFQSAGCAFGQSCTFDPVTEQLRTASIDYFQCETEDGYDAAPDLCDALITDEKFYEISLDPLFVLAPGVVKGDRREPDCVSSICYRAPVPYAMSVRANGYTDAADLVSLPNESPTLALKVPAGVFADAKTRVTLRQGMPAQVSINRDNELVAAAKVPLEIVNAFFSSFSEVLQLRINYNSDRERYMTSEDAF